MERKTTDLQCRRILCRRKLFHDRIVVAAIFDFQHSRDHSRPKKTPALQARRQPVPPKNLLSHLKIEICNLST